MDKNAQLMLKTLKKDKGYIMHEEITGTFKGKQVSYIHVYMENALINNQWNLDTFSNFAGRGYLIDTTNNQKSSIMATAKRKTTAKKKTIRKHAGINQTNGKLKKGWKFVDGIPVKSAPKSGLGRVAAKLCTRKNPDGSSSSYTAGNDGSCRYGGAISNKTFLTGPSKSKSKTKKTIRKHEGINQRTGRLKTGWRYAEGGKIVKAKAKK